VLGGSREERVVDGPAIEVTDLVKVYGGPANPVPVLRGVSFRLGPGERVALLGKSGSGKSTLLNLLGGLDRPTAGRILVAGRELAELDGRQRAAYRLATVGMIFQSYNLIGSRTALQNVELPMVFAGRPRGERRSMAQAALEAVGLGHRIDHRPNQLSGGEHQRVAIARALVNRPQVLLADEPTGNLDSVTAREVLELLTTHLERDGTTMILVTHDEELAQRAADRIVRMHDGRIVV
jgi:ABC-type lipoprotein export system ATPase subunit